MSKVYLTRYEEYPIYEPAEGGYYYAGQEVDEYYECESTDEAKEKLKDLKSVLEECGFRVWDDGAYCKSKYIGNGVLYIIEHTLGEHTKGWVPYC